MPRRPTRRLVVGKQRAEYVVVLCRIEHTDAIGQVDAQAHLADLAFDHRAAAEQDRARDPLVDQRLRRPQHPLVLAVAVDDALAAPAWRPRRQDA